MMLGDYADEELRVLLSRVENECQSMERGSGLWVTMGVILPGLSVGRHGGLPIPAYVNWYDLLLEWPAAKPIKGDIFGDPEWPCLREVLAPIPAVLAARFAADSQFRSLVILRSRLGYEPEACWRCLNGVLITDPLDDLSLVLAVRYRPTDFANPDR